MAPTFFREYQLLCEASIFPDGGARKYLRFGGYESFHNAALKGLSGRFFDFRGGGFGFALLFRVPQTGCMLKNLI